MAITIMKSAPTIGETFVNILNQRAKVTVLDTKTPTIVNVARILDKTVAETSNYAADLAAKYPNIAKAFKIYKWPLNVKSGCIFVGDKHKQVGERLGILMVGQHVFADYIEQQDKIKKQTNVEIFLSIPEIQRKYKVMQIIEKNGQKFKIPSKGENNDYWIYENVDKSLKELCEECGLLSGRFILSATNETRTVYIKDRWVGSPNRIAVVPVNYDWR